MRKNITRALSMALVLVMMLAVFPITASAADVTIANISTITAPVTGATPTTPGIVGTGYTGTVSWSPSDSTFKPGTVYTATITLALTDAANDTLPTTSSVTVNGAQTTTYFSDTGIIVAVFPATADAVITETTITGVIPPVNGGTPVTSITNNTQYTGTVTWSPAVSGAFAANTQYIATITLTPKAGYTLSGVVANFFTVTGAIATNAVDSGVITATFPATGATVINMAAIAGVTAPVAGATPVTSISNTQYTGTVTWNPAVSGTFAAGTAYTATITLTPATGYTLTGVTANFFTVAGATATNVANSGVITAVFPATATQTTGATPATPTLNTRGTTTVTLNPVSVSNGQTVQYGYATTVGGTITWQSGYSFSGLSSGTTYYFYTRTVATTSYTSVQSTSYLSVTTTTTSTTTIYITASSSSTSNIAGNTKTLDSASSTSYTASNYAETYYIYNAGSSSLSGIDVTVSSGSSYFSVSSPSSSLSSGSHASFKVTPKGSLSKGTYSGTIKITADNADTKYLYVKFTVGSSTATTDDFHVATSTSSKSSSAITKYTFTSKGAGYGDIDPITFYIHNDSGSKLTSVKAALSGDNKSSFTLSETSVGTIKADDYAEITVVPKTGLKKGTYEATLTITCDGEEYDVDLTFVVKTGDDLYFTEKKSGSAFSSFTFDSVSEGYSAPSAQTLYVYNDSNSSLKSVTLSLSGTDKSSFTLSTTSLGTISSGSYGTFTIVPKTNLAAGSYTAKVTAEASDGTSSTVTVNFTVKSGTTTPVTPSYVFPFSDVATGAWYYNDVLKANQQGLIDGYNATQFKPDENLSVAQAIKLAACVHQRYYNGSVTLTNGYPNWYDTYVTYAKNNGIISGDYLDYNAKITREEFVNIFYNALPASDYTILNTLSDTYIPDVQPGATYYSKIFRFYQAGILQGNGSGFSPKNNIKRSEVAAILTRLYDSSERISS